MDQWYVAAKYHRAQDCKANLVFILRKHQGAKILLHIDIWHQESFFPNDKHVICKRNKIQVITRVVRKKVSKVICLLYFLLIFDKMRDIQMNDNVCFIFSKKMFVS